MAKILFFLRHGFSVAQAGLEVKILLPSLPSAGITDMHHQAWPQFCCYCCWDWLLN
jgi:hypothetical protein